MNPYSEIILLILFLLQSCNFETRNVELETDKCYISFIESKNTNILDVLYDGELFTSYRWSNEITKPVLYPIISSTGEEITRGYPLNPKEEEGKDFPHQIGLWFSYGNVNGIDFWHNGSQGLGIFNPNSGIIKHVEFSEIKEGLGEGSIKSHEVWEDPSGQVLLSEYTEYRFLSYGPSRVIDRITTLQAGANSIKMPDTKEGMMGIRVAESLKLSEFQDGHSDDQIPGQFRNSEKIIGQEVWGKRARWISLFGEINGTKISIIVCDHKTNFNYPTWWHARGYGLIAANPLGGKDLTNGKEVVDFSIPAGETVTFKYRIIVHSGSFLNDKEINELTKDYSFR